MCIQASNISALSVPLHINGLRHGCRATERDFVPIHLESGDKGTRAQRRQENFVKNIIPYAWRYVPKREFRNGTPGPFMHSDVRAVYNGVHPNKNDKLERQKERKKRRKGGKLP